MAEETLPEFDLEFESPLKSLGLANTSIISAIPLSFLQLASMQWLDLSRNGITDGLANLNSMTNLTYLLFYLPLVT